MQWRSCVIFKRSSTVARFLSILLLPQSFQDKVTHTRRCIRTCERRCKELLPRWQTCRRANEKSVRAALFSDSLFFFFFFIIYFLFLNLSNASAPLHFFFIFFCVSIILHICLCDILIKINLSGCFPSQTSTTARDPNGKESKSVWKALLLCLRSSYLYIYLLIYLETLPSKHILAESLMCGL